MKYSTFVCLLAASFAFSACDCGDGGDSKDAGVDTRRDTRGNDATSDTANGDTGGDTNRGDGGTSCVPVLGVCSTSAECCDDRTCELDGVGGMRCTDPTTCGGTGATCSTAGQCCSLNCTSGACADSTGPLCKPSGLDATDNGCTADSDCCSDNCNTDTNLCEIVPSDNGESCATLGETCTSEGIDATCCSSLCVNFGTAGAPELRCGRSSSCQTKGDICAEAADCCSGYCDDDGRCPSQNEIGGSRLTGEVCDNDAQCVTKSCAPDFPGGISLCQALGGCRVAGDGSTGSLCSEDWECCGYRELSAGPNMCLPDDGNPPSPGSVCAELDAINLPGLKTCQLQTTDKETGEICKFADDMNMDGMIDPATELTDLHTCCCKDGVDCCQPSTRRRLSLQRRRLSIPRIQNASPTARPAILRVIAVAASAFPNRAAADLSVANVWPAAAPARVMQIVVALAASMAYAALVAVAATRARTAARRCVGRWVQTARLQAIAARISVARTANARRSSSSTS